jgi:hypothetical protein
MLIPKTSSSFLASLFSTGEPALVVVSARFRGRITAVHDGRCFSSEGCIFRCGALDAGPELDFDGENCDTVYIDIMDDS